MYQTNPPRPPAETLPTMYELPSEDPEEPGLPDVSHDFQPQLLRETCQTPTYPASEIFIGADINLYYDSRHSQWYKRPDWFLSLGVEQGTDVRELRWSYVVWQEGVSPFLVVELLSPGTEDEDLGQKGRGRKVRELGKPPLKWDVYEQILRVPYYVVFDRYEQNLRVFQLHGNRYESAVLPDARFWFEELQLGLGVWEGGYQGIEGQWLRWYDRDGNLILTPMERAQLAEQQVRSAIPRLASLGLTSAQIAETLSLSIEMVEQNLGEGFAAG